MSSLWARALAGAPPLRWLEGFALADRGIALPKDGSTLDIRCVINAGKFKSHDPWLRGADLLIRLRLNAAASAS